MIPLGGRMGRWVALRTIIASCAGMLVAACSSASYEAPVAKFAAATDAAEASLAKLNADIGKAYWDVQKARLGRGDLLLIEQDGDCNIGSARCRLVIEDRQGQRIPYTDRGPLENALEVMAAISAYADGLAAIIAADTAQAVEGHVNTTLGNVQKLAATVAAAGGSPAGTGPDFAAPAAQLVNWVVGRYVEKVKLGALRRATAEAAPVIREAAELFGRASFFAVSGTRSELTARVRTEIDALGPTPAPAIIERAAAAARTYDVFLQSDPAAAFKAMAKAHTALADNLADRNVSFASMAAEIERFVTEAEKLVQAAKQVSALLDKKE